MIAAATRNRNGSFDFLFDRDRLQRETLARATANGRLLWTLLLFSAPALLIVYVAAGMRIREQATRNNAGVSQPAASERHDRHDGKHKQERVRFAAFRLAFINIEEGQIPCHFVHVW